jgi:hypothetical protein
VSANGSAHSHAESEVIVGANSANRPESKTSKPLPETKEHAARTLLDRLRGVSEEPAEADK